MILNIFDKTFEKSISVISSLFLFFTNIDEGEKLLFSILIKEEYLVFLLLLSLFLLKLLNFLEIE